MKTTTYVQCVLYCSLEEPWNSSVDTMVLLQQWRLIRLAG